MNLSLFLILISQLHLLKYEKAVIVHGNAVWYFPRKEENRFSMHNTTNILKTDGHKGTHWNHSL